MDKWQALTRIVLAGKSGALSAGEAKLKVHNAKVSGGGAFPPSA
jgi:hypothetical protein